MQKLTEEEKERYKSAFDIKDFNMFLVNCPDCSADLLMIVDKTGDCAHLKFLKHNC
jgi:hypothetical protein